MGLENANLVVAEAATKMFIQFRPEDVVLSRVTLVSDGMGGIVEGSRSPLSPQQMRLVPARSITEQAPVRVTPDGQQVTPNWYLVADNEADVQIGDTATVRGHNLEVIFVSNIPEERIVAECWENF